MFYYFNFDIIISTAESIAFCRPSGFLPPAVAKNFCPPPPPSMAFAASRTTAPASAPRATISSPSMTASIGLPSVTQPIAITIFDALSRKV